VDAVLLEHRPTVVPLSTGTGRATGLEVLVRRERGRVTGWAGYTLAKSTRDLYGFTVPFDFDRRHALSVLIDGAVTRRVRAAMTWRIASGFPITPVLEEPVFVGSTYDSTTRTTYLPYVAARDGDGRIRTSADMAHRRLSTLNSERLSGYQRADVRVTYATLGHWEFYGEVLHDFNNRSMRQTVSETNAAGERVQVGKANIYDTFARMFSYGMRVRF
jgi:hypothetical protein